MSVLSLMAYQTQWGSKLCLFSLALAGPGCKTGVLVSHVAGGQPIPPGLSSALVPGPQPTAQWWPGPAPPMPPCSLPVSLIL